MKNSLLLFSFLFVQLLFAQEKTIEVSKDTKVIDDNLLYSSSGVEVKPEFPGGIEEFYKYIQKIFRTPREKNFKGGRIYAQFTVEKDGSLTDIKIKDIGYGTKDEATRILKKCPKWIPGEQSGKKIRCSFTLPITLTSN